ncbi:hypothetical protein ACGFQG_19240 [Nocardia fluminea]|uniref:hypothetical protein n=1 Tax=Nocardia fluminea TaxID=134984 RepID=UPI00371B9E1C
MYWLDTMCYGGNKKPTRPAVVIRSPIPGLLDDVIVICRTSKQEYSHTHVRHSADLALGLDRPGAFAKSYRRHVDLGFFAQPQFTSYQGQLGEPYLDQILRMTGMA